MNSKPKSRVATLIEDGAFQETLRGFEGIIAAGQKSLKSARDEAKADMYYVLEDFNSICEDIRISRDNDFKKEVKAAYKYYSKRLSQIEKYSTRLIHDTLTMPKKNLQEALDDSRQCLGKRAKDLEKEVKDMRKFMEKISEEYVQAIHDNYKTVQAELKNSSQKYIK